MIHPWTGPSPFNWVCLCSSPSKQLHASNSCWLYPNRFSTRQNSACTTFTTCTGTSDSAKSESDAFSNEISVRFRIEVEYSSKLDDLYTMSPIFGGKSEHASQMMMPDAQYFRLISSNRSWESHQTFVVALKSIRLISLESGPKTFFEIVSGVTARPL